MGEYQVRPYKAGRWVIVEAETGREIILFNRKDHAEKACQYLNEREEQKRPCMEAINQRRATG